MFDECVLTYLQRYCLQMELQAPNFKKTDMSKAEGTIIINEYVNKLWKFSQKTLEAVNGLDVTEKGEQDACLVITSSCSLLR